MFQINSTIHVVTVRAMNQDSRRKDYLPAYIFIDCATSLKHYNNPKSAFIVHYHEEGKTRRERKPFNVITVTYFLGMNVNLISILNIALDAPALFTILKMRTLSVTETI